MSEGAGIFSSSAAVYDLLYQDRDTTGEARWVGEQLRRHGVPESGQILELGTGTGRHARLLADQGFLVTGVEPSRDMLEKVAEHPRVSYLQGDGQTIRLNTRFDAVISLFHVVSYQTSLAAAHAFFATASAHLEPGGIFAFDVWYSPAVHALKPQERIVSREDSALQVTRHARPTENVADSLVDVHFSYEVTDKSRGVTEEFSEVHSMRHFSSTEIVLLSEAHGLEITDSQEFMSGAKPSRDTWGVWFVARKA